jgi:hypothetical protein
VKIMLCATTGMVFGSLSMIFVLVDPNTSIVTVVLNIVVCFIAAVIADLKIMRKVLSSWEKFKAMTVTISGFLMMFAIFLAVVILHL